MSENTDTENTVSETAEEAGDVIAPPREEQENSDTPESAEVASEGDVFGDVTISFPEEAEPSSLDSFIESVKRMFEKGKALRADVSAVKLMTVAGIQACIAVNREASARNIAIKWVAPSAEFMKSFDEAGFYAEMMKMEFA